MNTRPSTRRPLASTLARNTTPGLASSRNQILHSGSVSNEEKHSLKQRLEKAPSFLF